MDIVYQTNSRPAELLAGLIPAFTGRAGDDAAGRVLHQHVTPRRRRRGGGRKGRKFGREAENAAGRP